MLNAFYSKDDSSQEVRFDYWLSLPDDFSEDERLPLIVFLHGAGERGPDLEKVKVHGIPKLIESEPYCSMRVVTFSPQCQDGRIWNTQLYDLMAQIDYIAKKYHVDPDAVSVTGLSMGGYGTWMLAQTFPEYFSAAAPVCGGGISWLMSEGLLKLPIRAYHGDADTVVPCRNSIEMVDAIATAGGRRAALTIYHRTGHDSWVNAYEQTDLIRWLSEQRRG